MVVLRLLVLLVLRDLTLLRLTEHACKRKEEQKKEEEREKRDGR